MYLKPYLFPLINKSDKRGNLIACEFVDLPFSPLRFFSTTVCESGTIRGGHGHLNCEQILFCLKGKLLIRTKIANNAEVFELTSNGMGLYIPPKVWTSQEFITGDDVLGCLTSLPYDETDYILQDLVF